MVEELAAGEPLSAEEAAYVAAARAQNTMRGYASDWRDFTAWCAQHDRAPLPAAASTVTAYLSDLAAAGAKVGTMSRRLSALKFVHAGRGLPDPTSNARVMTVWEGIRRTHAAPPDQARPLMPPELFDILEACPVTKTWKTKGRPPEPDLAGARDRALLLVGFVGALRRSELAGLRVRDVGAHANGLVLTLPRSKTNQTGDRPELVVLPRASRTDRCPVTALEACLTLAGITDPSWRRPAGPARRGGDRGAAVEAPVRRAMAAGRHPPRGWCTSRWSTATAAPAGGTPCAPRECCGGLTQARVRTEACTYDALLPADPPAGGRHTGSCRGRGESRVAA